MIAIKFNAIYEDRVSIYFKTLNLKEKGIEYGFEESPSDFEDRFSAYWLIEPRHNKQINIILSALKELKNIMGVEDLMFCYCFSKKEFFTQYTLEAGLIPWFNI